MLSNEQITKYQTLYKSRFGKEISAQEALEQGTLLLSLLKLIYKPMTENDYKRLQKRREEMKNL